MQYTCWSCLASFYTKRIFHSAHRTHQAMCGQEEGETGFDSERNFVECQICLCQVVHSRLELERHMEKTHCGFGLRHYFEYFVHTTTSVHLLGGKRPKLELTRCKEPPYNIRTIQSDSNEDISEAEVLLRQAPKSEEVVNKCAFKCPHCKNRFNNWPAIYIHNRIKKYDCRGINGGYTKWEEVAVQVVTHECQVCGYLLPCDKDKVACHLTRHHHGLRAHEYRAYIEEKKRPGSEKTLKQFLEEFKKKENKVKEEQNRIKQEVPVVSEKNIGKVEKKSVTMQVGNMCWFSCTKCTFETDSYIKIKCHWRKKCRAENLTKSKSFVKEARIHMCHMCARKIVCDKYFIGLHVRRHGISIANYIALVEKNLTSISGEALKELVEKREKVPFIKRVKNQIKKDSRRSNPQLALRNSVPVVTLPEGHFLTLPPDNIPRDKTTLLFENLCTFSCCDCSSTFEDYKRFRIHIAQSRCRPFTGKETKRHNNGGNKNHPGIDLVPSEVKEARYHFCHLCGRSVLCDRSIMAGHIIHHKLTKENYSNLVNKNMKKRGGAIFPPTQEEEPNPRRCLVEDKPSPPSADSSVIAEQTEKQELKLQSSDQNALVYKNLGSMSESLQKEVLEEFGMEPDEQDEQKTTSQHNYRSQVPVVVHSQRNFVLMPRNSLGRDKTTLLFENLCLFTCCECSSVFEDYNRFYLHISQSRCFHVTEEKRSNARIKKNPGFDLIPSQVKEARYHFCHICGRCILCDKTIIVGHFKQHKVSEENYFNLVNRNIQKFGGAIFPPPLEEESPKPGSLVLPMSAASRSLPASKGGRGGGGGGGSGGGRTSAAKRKRQDQDQRKGEKPVLVYVNKGRLSFA